MKFTCLDVAQAASLEVGLRRGKEQSFRCPRHDDAHPSLVINPDKDTWLCGPCNAHGTAYQLAAFLAERPPDDKDGVLAWVRAHGLLGQNGNGHGAPQPTGAPPTIKRCYPYRDEHGAEQYESVRYTPKAFKRRRPDGHGGWIPNLAGVELLPYALERLVDSTPDVYITEGEEDAENLWARGVPATTNIGGAGQWQDTYSRRLVTAAGVQRANVVPDHDEPGHRHAVAVARSLHAAGIEVRVLALPGLHDGQPWPSHGRDISDWLVEHSIEELRAVAAAAPIWTPSAAATPVVPSHWQFLDLADRHAWSCAPLVPIVDGLIARGNYVNLSAESQTGKTLFGLYLARTLVHGGPLFQRYAVTPVERLLYLVLEDPARRIQARLLDIDAQFPTDIAPGRCTFGIVPGFALTGKDARWDWLEHTITAERRDVVILDTYQRATPGINSFDDKEQGPILHRLADVTRRIGTTLIQMDHVRKQPSGARFKRGDLTLDDIKGSGGKAQNVDCVILMERTADKRAIKFQSYSKDFDVPVRVLLTVAPRGSTEPKFTIAGDLDDLGKQSRERGERTRAAVLAALSSEWSTTKAVAARLGKCSESTVLRHLKDLVAAGKAEHNGKARDESRYRVRQSSDGARLTDE